jgi:hypothetical protein
LKLAVARQNDRDHEGRDQKMEAGVALSRTRSADTIINESGSIYAVVPMTLKMKTLRDLSGGRHADYFARREPAGLS